MKRFPLLVVVILLFPGYLGAVEIPQKETFTYRITWNGVMPVGEASLTMCREEGILAMEIKARTIDPVDTFFSVRDRFFSSAPEDLSAFLHYEKKLREGKYRRYDVITYNPSTGLITYTKNGKKKAQWTHLPPLYDPFSILFAYRFLCPLEETCHLTATDGKHLEVVAVVPIKEEEVKVAGKTFLTEKVEPRWKHMKGIFKKKKKGHIYVWFTKDKRRIPVKVEADIFLGKVKGTLKGWKIKEGTTGKKRVGEAP